MKMSYKDSYEEDFDKYELIDKVISMFVAEEPFENIICIDNSQVKGKRGMCKFIEDYIIPRFDVKQLEKYFFEYYYLKYNTTYIWGGTSYYEFWKYYGFQWRVDEGYNDLYNIAKSAFDEVYSKWAFVPQCYRNRIDECICSGIALDEEGFQYTKRTPVTKEKFLEYYLIQKYSEDELEEYISKVSKFYLEENSNIGVAKLIGQIFKTRSDSGSIEKYMNKIYRLTIKSTFKHTFRGFKLKRALELAEKIGISDSELEEYYYSVRWKEADIVQKEWSNYTSEQLKVVFEEINNVFLKDRDKFSKIRILEKKYGISTEMSKRYHDKIFNRVPNTIEINKLIKSYSHEQPKKLMRGNTKEMVKGKKIWKLYATDKNMIRLITMHFHYLPKSIKADVQDYIKYNYDIEYNKLRSTSDVIIVLNKIINKFPITSLRELTNEKLLIVLHELNRETYSGNLRRRYIYSLNAFYKYINTTAKYKKKPLENPTTNIRLANVAVNTQHTKYIPLEVRYAIDQHIDELDWTTRLCYRILTETGLRFTDQMQTEVTDIVLEDRHVEQNEKYARFYYIVSKTKNSRIKSNTFEKRFVHITYDLYLEIKQYIHKFEMLRTELKTNRLLVNKNNKGEICNVNCRKINTHLNKLINKFNITTEDGKPWRFTTRQLRKSVAVDLISNGATLYSVQSALGHATSRTTEIYYAEVDKMQVMKLNTKFFSEKFKVLNDSSVFKCYTEEERKILYIDFLRKQREVEFGICCKHPSEGTCSSLGQHLCATCPKLITGKKYLPKWKELYEDSKARLEELENIYRKNNILEEDYRTYIEYAKEKGLAEKYSAVIKAIQVMEENQ